MNYIYSGILLIISFAMIVLLILSKNFKGVKGLKQFRILTYAFLFHIVGYAFEMVSSNLTYMLMMIKVEYIGISFIPVLLVWFANEYTDEYRYFNKRLLKVLLAFSVLSFIIVLTNELHGLYYSNVDINYSYNFPVLDFERGPWYMILGLFSIFSSLYTSSSIGIHYFKSTKAYKKQILTVWIGFSIPIITMFYYAFELGPAHIDLIPFSYGLLYFITLSGLLRYKSIFFNSVSHDVILNLIDEGVIVIDYSDIVVSINDACLHYFDEIAHMKEGSKLDDSLILKKIINNKMENPFLVNDRHFKYKVTDSKESKCRVLVLSEVTDYVNSVERLKEISVTDKLTGLYNRGYFTEELNKMNQYSYVILMDIDDFKFINDNFGHNKGDEVLIKIGKIIKDNFASHVVSRYGGEEFSILIEEMGKKELYSKAEKMRNDFMNSGYPFKTTISIGISYTVLGDVRKTMSNVDKLLYEAKNSGKNKIVTDII